MRKVAVRKASSQNLSCMDALASKKGQLQQYDDVFAQQSHFVGEHEDKKRDV